MKKSRLIFGMFFALGLLIVISLSTSAQPGNFSLTSPENNENIKYSTPQFQWHGADNADNYKIVIDNDSGLGSPLYDNDNLGNTTNFNLPSENALENDGIYYWGVRAENEDGYTWSDENWQFRLDTIAPPAPSLGAPENELNENSPTISFIWENLNSIENALPVTYHIKISPDSGFSSIENENTRVTDNSYSYTFTENNKFYWRVQAQDNAGNWGSWSVARWIRIDTVDPPAPSPQTPENNSTTNDNTPKLTWGNIDSLENSTPIKYYVAVSDNSQFPYENENSGWITDDNYQISNSLSDDNWYWHVRAKDNAGNVGENSGWYKFQVDKHMPGLVSPADGKNIADNTPTFKWENVAIVDNFELQIDSDSSFTTPIYDNKGITENKADPIENQLPDDNYYWRVRSYENGNPSSFSSVRSFRVDTLAPAAPEQTSPPNNFENNDNTPTLKWNTVSENSTPIRYRVAVSDDSQFPYENENMSWSSGTTSWTTPELAEGTWYWQVRAKDNLGNVGDNSQRSLRVDVTAPTISGITESSVDKDSATIEWDTDELADSEIEYKKSSESTWNSKSEGSLVTSHSMSLLDLLTDNTYDYKVKSTDNAGNTGSSAGNQFTTPALQPPSSSIDTIENYWYTSSPITISASASDSDGSVENVTLYYQHRENTNDSWGSWTEFDVDTDGSDNWSWSFDMPQSDGLYEFHTLAKDDDAQTENETHSADEEVGFDTVAPILSSVRINGDNTVVTSGSVTISIDAEDATSGLDKMRFSDDNQTWESWEPFENERGYDLSMPEGDKTIYAQVKDTAGLTSDKPSDSILLENATFTKSLGSISENSHEEADFAGYGTAVKSVALYASKNTPNSEVSLQVSEQKPIAVDRGALRKLAYYFQVETNASNENLSEVQIEFDVEKSWLDNRGIDSEDLELWKWDDGWESVSLVIIGENTTTVQCRTSVSGLSWFAVSGGTAAEGGISMIWILAAILIGVAIFVVALLYQQQVFEEKGIPKRGL